MTEFQGLPDRVLEHLGTKQPRPHASSGLLTLIFFLEVRADLLDVSTNPINHSVIIPVMNHKVCSGKHISCRPVAFVGRRYIRPGQFMIRLWHRERRLSAAAERSHPRRARSVIKARLIYSMY
jgi:hypothetical protein